MKTKKNAFTLIELIIVIALIAIFAFLIINYRFNTIGDKQKLEIFTNKIISEIETVRTNSLVGKGIGDKMEVPSYWEIIFSRNNNGEIITNYYVQVANGINYNKVEFNKISVPEGMKITKIVCNNTNTELALNKKGAILFEGSKTSIGGDCLATYNILNLTMTYKDYTEKLEFNALNGLTERIK